MSAELHEVDRREIFCHIVSLQDQGASVSDARRCVAEFFEISTEDVLDIEIEGLTKEWPPLRDSGDEQLGSRP